MSKKLQFEKRDWGLPGGDFFDGSFFRDCMGNIHKSHPRVDEILQSYIKEENERIAADNEAKKEREKYRRKFYSNM
jgi:hypothetical protein